MKIYYDTEFIEDGSTIDLVSIGMVAEDGREFYAVSAEFDQRKLLSNSWLRENVWPSLPTTEPRQYRDGLPPHGHLDADHPDVRPRAQIARAVADFIQATPDVELWAWYGAYDHVALCQLWGRMIDLPEGVPMFTCDLKQEAERLGNPPLPQQAEGLHNALADARHNKVMAEFLAALTGEDTP
jgi:3'-5' exoribonuclease-like protein